MDHSSKALELIQRFYALRIRIDAKHAVTATSLYENYCHWCEGQHLTALPLHEFARWFGVFGVAKARIAGRECYLGVALVGADEQHTRPGDHSVQSYCKDRLRSEFASKPHAAGSL